MKWNKNSVFIDQGMFYPVLYSDKYPYNTVASVKLYGSFGLKMLVQNRVKLWIDLQDWADYLLSEEFSFSCGSRIHGNIMAILCGIPAAICPPDARVREMAEFFEIPMITEADLKKRNLYEIYCNTDFSRFNRNLGAKFDAYEAFLKERGIVKAVNDTPMLRIDRSAADTSRLAEIHQQIHRERILDIYSRQRRNPALRAYGAARRLAIHIVESTHNR